MMNNVKPCLWFDDNAEAAAEFYTSLFQNSRIVSKELYTEASSEASGQPVGSVATVEFELAGQEFVVLNGGPLFKFTPATSFFVSSQNEQEIDLLYARLSDGGSDLMPYQQYPWSKKYAWVNDRFGVSWQIMVSPETPSQKIVPSLMFHGERVGKATEAMNFYTSIFPNSKIEFSYPHPEDQGGPDLVARAEFTINGYRMGIMDSPIEHQFDFTHAISFMVKCPTQVEIDKYWDELLADGGRPEQCGWLADKYGIAWQIVPEAMDEFMRSSDKAKVERATAALMKMVKIDAAALMNA